MDKYYFSGLDRRSFFEILAKEKAAAIINRNIVSKKFIIKLIKEYYNDIELILDSGAFQGYNNIEEYIKEFLPVVDYFKWVVSLDVIGNQELSDLNYYYILDNISTRYHNKILWVFQDGTEEYLNEILQTNKFIGVGGLVPLSRNRDALVERINWIGKLLIENDAKAHFFGIGSYNVIQEFKSNSWFYSADSQIWLVGAKAYELLLVNGKRMRSRDAGLILSKNECLSNNVRVTQEWIS